MALPCKMKHPKMGGGCKGPGIFRMPRLWDPLPDKSTPACNLSAWEKCELQKREDQEALKFITASADIQQFDRRQHKEEFLEMQRRLQAERLETDFEACKFQAEEHKRNRMAVMEHEERMAWELRRLKDNEIREAAFRKRLHEESPEIRELNAAIAEAYNAKALYGQLKEKQYEEQQKSMAKRTDVNHAERAELLRQIKQYEDEERCKLEQECLKKRQYMKELQEQMELRKKKEATKYEDYKEDKERIDELVEMIRIEDEQEVLMRKAGIQKTRAELEQFLTEHRRAKEEEKRKLAEEERKIKEYEQRKAQEVDHQARAKEERERIKAELMAKANEKVLQERIKAEEMEELRRELHWEMLEEEGRRKDAEEAARKYNQMLELQAAERESRELRTKKLEQEKREMEEFRKKLLEKYAEDERLEQLSYQKRRQKEREHHKLVEDLIYERRARYAQEQEKLQAEWRCFENEQKEKEKAIEDERLRLLKLHGPHIFDYLPKNFISRRDLEKLGITSSKPEAARKIPDPTTIDPADPLCDADRQITQINVKL